MIVPRAVAKEGYMDIDDDDHSDTKRQYFHKDQIIQLNIIKDKWVYGEGRQGLYKQ